MYIYLMYMCFQMWRKAVEVNDSTSSLAFFSIHALLSIVLH